MGKEPEVTVSRDYLQNIEKKVEDLKTLTEVSAIISSTLDYNDLIALVMEKAKKVMDAEACSLLLYNRDTNKLEFEVALCKTEETSDALK
jgi:sigma-B regulation protein RsbU (phosphoserine phosphatase)